MEKPRKPAAVRTDYMIEGFRVSLLHQEDWKCACRDFNATGSCRHTREARGMLEAQALIRKRLGSRTYYS